MKDDVATLEITPHELEKVCGREVNDLFIGGIVGGVLRSSALASPTKLLSLLVVEVAVSGLLFIFTLPLSFAMTRNINLQQASGAQLFMGITIGIAIALIGLWNASMFLRAKHFNMLMRLLDEIDRFNELVRAVDVVDRLDGVKPEAHHFENRLEILNALNVTRDSLISGMMTEKILRENRGLLSRRQDLLTHIETNLSALSVMAVSDEASDYSRILNEALQIGAIVQREMMQVSRS
jgi:uncharacterized membrane protein YiaA